MGTEERVISLFLAAEAGTMPEDVAWHLVQVEYALEMQRQIAAYSELFESEYGPVYLDEA